MLSIWKSGTLLLAVFLVASCGDSPPATAFVAPPAATPPVAVVRVFADSLLHVGETSAAHATALDSRYVEISGRAVRWSVDDPAVLSVSDSGVATALAPGHAKLSATIDGVVGDAAIVVVPSRAASVTVSIDLARLVIGAQARAKATAVDAGGRTLTGRAVRWAVVANPTVASVSDDGIISALAEGQARIEASIDSVVGAATIEVAPAGDMPRAVTVSIDSTQLTVGSVAQARAVASDSLGKLLGGYPVQWQVAGSVASATVSMLGLVTAIAPGAVQIRAIAGAVSGEANLTVQTSSANIALPELPRVHLVTTYVPPTGRSIRVRASDDLQAALNAAKRGDELVLDAGARFRGNFILPKLAGSASDGWVIMRSSSLPSLPEGERVTPAQASLLARIETPGSQPAIATALGASGWRLAGLEVTVDSAFGSQQYGLITFGDGSAAQASLADVATDLTLDRSYVHGTTTSSVKRCVALNSARSAVIDSYITDCHVVGFDSQAILGWNGPGPFKIENNTLMGASENVMFGGADPSIPGLVPADIEIRRNYFYTPLSWRGVWQKKNLFELKNAERVLFESNVLDGSWLDGQTGYAMQLKIENQGGACAWCRTFDVTVRGNVIRNVGAAFNLAGYEGGSPYPVIERLTRVLIEQNLVSDVGVPPYTGDQRLFLVQNDVRDLTIRNNTITTIGSLNAFLYLGRASAARRFEFSRNIVTDGTYGLFGDALGEGLAALGALSETVTILGNAVIGPSRPRYPAGMAFVVDLTAARAVPGAGADETSVQRATSGLIR